MPLISHDAIALLAELLEEAEQTQSICEDVAPWCDRKPQIEELWTVYENLLEAVK